MSHVIAIDLGTSGVKVAVVDREGRVAGSASAPLETTFLRDGGAEQDPEAWWRAIGACSHRALGDAGVDGAAIEAIAVTSQYMSIVAVDAAGLPLTHAVMWMDRRGAKHLRRDIDVGLWLDRHGLPPMGGCDQGHIALLRVEQPDVYAAAAAFVEPVDALNARLTGRIAATQTTAFPLMTVDNRTHGVTAHDADLVAGIGIEPEKLPPLVPFDEIVGTVTADAAQHLGITTSAVVVTGAIDSITSGVGCGVLDDRACAVVIGTTSVIVTHIDRKDADLDHALVSVPSPIPGRWFVMAENGVGGRALDLFLREIVYGDDAMSLGPFPHDAFERAERAASSAPAGSDGVLFLPWLAGSIAPVADNRVRAAFVNVGLATTRPQLARAVYEGVALNAAWLLPHVAAFADATWPSIRFGGGGAASSLWSQVLADCLDTAVEQLASPTTVNARGAAFLALARLGHIELGEIPALLDVKQTFEPDADRVATYRALSERFVELHSLLRPRRKESTHERTQ